MAITEYLGGLINAIIFTIAFVLFLVVKLKDNLTKKTLHAYFAFTFIFAITSIYSIFIKMADKSGFKEAFYTYFVGFVLNAIFGMIILHSFDIKAFYAFFSIFIASILGVLYILTKSPDSVTNLEPNPWFNLTGWDDFLKKTHDIFHYKWELDDCKNVFSKMIWIIKAIFTLPFWFIYAVFSGLSGLFGFISPPQTSSPQQTPSWMDETFPVYFRKSITYSLVLLLFIMAIIIIVAYQDEMRNQPLNVLTIAFVVAFTYLGYVRFFQSESFVTQFILTLFALFMIGIYLYNPYEILKNITGLNFTIIIFICLFLIGIIFIYNYFTLDSAGIATKWEDNFRKIAYSMIGLSICISLIIWIVGVASQLQSEKPTVGMYILNTLIVVGMLTIVYNLLDVNKLFKDSLYAKLIVNMIFYIPCLLSDLADLVMSEYYKMNYFTLIIVVLEIIFIIAYWFIYPDIVSKIYSGEGKLLINDHISLASLKTVGYYRNFARTTMLDYKDNQNIEETDSSNGKMDGENVINSVSGKPLLDASGNPINDVSGNTFFPTKINTYSYSISFWLYINPMPSHGDKFFSLLNYGYNPNIMYNPRKNDFSVFMKSPDTDCSPIKASDTERTIPIYTNTDIPLQKWFNVVLNYDSGRLDVFLNAELVKTSFDVISCIKYDALTIGEDSGANAKICNLTYFQQPVDIVSIRTMYNVAKIEDIPNVPKKDLFSI
jgi:hypothetical protein